MPISQPGLVYPNSINIKMAVSVVIFLLKLICALAPCNVPKILPQSSFTESLENEEINPYPIVWIKNGGIQGYSMATMKGRRIFAFEGIPFAEPPIGNLRFKSPLPKSSWKGILHAFRPSKRCLQGHPLEYFRVSGSEDCLYLNIYTPKIPRQESSKSLLPVIAFLHGGSFMYGAGSDYGPAYILNQDVILVTINYRLGALGFLSTGDSVSPGNYGLKDQVLALKWIHDNIADFGGNRSKVTLLGQSAGGVSSHLHAVSNVSRDYFQSGISQSGSGFCHWGVLSPSRAKYWTTELAARMNCPSENSQELIKCLKNCNPVFLVAAQQQLFEWIPLHPLIVFAPVVEPEGPDAFLTQTPAEAYAKNEVAKLPWMFSTTSQEGYFEIYVLHTLMQTLPVRMNLKKYLPYILDYHYLLKDPKKSDVTEKLINFYNTGKYIASLDSISDMYGDRYFVIPVQKAIRAHAKIARTYASVFNFKGEYNVGSIFGIAKYDWGISHAEDNFYYFNSSLFYPGFKKQDQGYSLSKIMINFLTNFARNREPNNVENVDFWQMVNPNVNVSVLNLLHFGKIVSMIPDPFHTRMQFWEDFDIKDYNTKI